MHALLAIGNGLKSISVHKIFRRKMFRIIVSLLVFGVVRSEEWWRFEDSYPKQLIAHKVARQIVVDGKLSFEEWGAWGDEGQSGSLIVDNAQELHPGAKIPEHFQTAVKVQYDADFFYVAAMLREPVIWGNIEGHNDKLTNHRAPYWNTDFEVFVEPSGSGHFYKEFEMNVRNATYDILWRVADGGFSSIGVPCDNNSTSWCQNSTYNQGHLPGEQSWSMVSPTCAPSGLASSTSYGGRNTATYCPFTQENASKMWTVEIAFPLRKASDHGGLLDAGDGLDYSPFDPNVNSGVFWWVDSQGRSIPS